MIELLCIQTHSQGAVIAGNTYSFISESTCDCGLLLYDVNIKISNFPKYRTSNFTCQCGRSRFGDIWWINSKYFAQIATEQEVKEHEQQLQEL